MAQGIFFALFYFTLFMSQTEETTGMTLWKNVDSPAKCEHCDGPSEKSKRRNFTKENKSKYFQRLNDNFYKYKHAGKAEGKYSLSRGWGAAGMPFNVLYTPNSYQQKILKSVPTTGRRGREHKDPPEIFDLVLEEEKPPPRGKETSRKAQHTPRKYYSLIPQLFVYGW